jgi:uncharacterized protein
MSQENVEVVRRLLDQYNSAGEPPWELIDPDVEWVIDPNAWMGGTYRGHDGVRQFFGRVAEAFDRFQLEVDSFLDAGDAVVVTTGQPLASVFRVRDGRIVAYRSYFEAKEALEAAGLRE